MTPPTGPTRQLPLWRRVGRGTRSGRDQGAAAVEFALVVPVLVLLVAGTFEFGIAYNAHATISQAAREGARVLAVGGTSDVARTATKTAAAGVELTDAQISVTPATCLGASPSATATVRVSYPFTFITSLFGSGFTLTGVGVMRCEG